MISTLHLADKGVAFEVGVDDPNIAEVVALVGSASDVDVAMIVLDRNTACRLFVALRGWLFATEQKAIKQKCYHDKEIIN